MKYGGAKDMEDAGRVYNRSAKSRMFESVPYVLKGSEEGVIERQRQEQPHLRISISANLWTTAWSTARQARFRTGFGLAIREEQQKKQALSYGRKHCVPEIGTSRPMVSMNSWRCYGGRSPRAKTSRLEAENRALREQVEQRRPGQSRLKVSEKGGVRCTVSADSPLLFTKNSGSGRWTMPHDRVISQRRRTLFKAKQQENSTRLGIGAESDRLWLTDTHTDDRLPLALRTVRKNFTGGKHHVRTHTHGKTGRRNDDHFKPSGSRQPADRCHLGGGHADVRRCRQDSRADYFQGRRR